MAEEYDTVAGPVILEPDSPGRWRAFLKREHRFLGTVELVSEVGEYEVTVAGRKPQSCANLRAAVQVIGSAG